MSAGNGRAPLDINGSFTVSDVDRVRLSAAQREQQREAYCAAVDHMAKTIIAQNQAIDWLMAQHKELRGRVETIERHIKRHEPNMLARIDAVEIGAAMLSAWVRRPLWERLRAWVGL